MPLASSVSETDMSGEDRFVLCMLAPAVAILGVLVAYPVGLLVFNSFSRSIRSHPIYANGSGCRTMSTH